MTAAAGFVSAPAVTPTVTLSLTQPGLVKVLADSFSLGAPEWEGDSLTGRGSYGTRTVEFTVQVTGTYQQAATFAQKLARAIAQGSPSWLMFRWSTGDDPMFALVYPSSMRPLDWQSGGVEVWNIPVSLLCDAALYGAPETGNVTVNNDPVAGSNPCFWRIGTTVKGDIETPLLITTGTASDLASRTFLTASSALKYGLTQTAPYIVQLNVASGVTASGWTTGSGDAAMSGGNYWRYTSTGAGAQGATLTWNAGQFVMAGNPIGDYRVLLRYRSSAPGDGWTVWLGQLDGGSTGDAARPAPTAGWMDLGVFRFPASAPDVDTLFNTTPAPFGTRIQLNMALAAGSVAGDTLDLDTLMFVPAGLDQAAANHLALTLAPSGISGSVAAAFDAVNDSSYLLSSGQIGLRSPSVVGTLPTVVPGCDNSLTFLRTIAAVDGAATDAISTSTVLNWTYWPRYLHARPTGS